MASTSCSDTIKLLDASVITLVNWVFITWVILLFFSVQVITGGNYDVDLELSGPDNKALYKEMKKQYDTFAWTTDTSGEYRFCFSNEFSTFTHKLVYFDFQVCLSSKDTSAIFLSCICIEKQTGELLAFQWTDAVQNAMYACCLFYFINSSNVDILRFQGKCCNTSQVMYCQFGLKFTDKNIYDGQVKQLFGKFWAALQFF